MSTKFISVNGYEKIERIKGSKKVRKQLAVKTSEKKTKRMDNILSMLYYIVVVPATFFSGIVKFITPSKKNKRKSFSRKKFMYNRVAPTLAIILLVLTVGYWTNWIDFGLNVQLDGQTVASVSDSGVIQHAKEITNDKLNKDTDASFTPVYQIGVVNQNEASNNAQTVSNAMVETDTNVTDDVAGLYVNDELIGVCSSATELQNKLDEIINKAKKKYKDNTEINFYNEVKVESGIFNSNSVEDTDSLIKKAEKKELLQVLVKADQVVTENLPYSTKVKYDKSKDSSYKKVIKKGVTSKQETTYKVSFLDGVQIDAAIMNVKTVKKSSDQVIVKGNGKKKANVSNKGFMWPAPSVHSISSSYGYREGGEFHTGLDIADGNCYGATVVASKSGTVEWAGYDDSGYGNYVIINHGDGYKTLYGHCSSVSVSQGQKVTQGQTIAAIGSTGQSTGNHLHFEVRTGDERSDRQNPLDYVSYW